MLYKGLRKRFFSEMVPPSRTVCYPGGPFTVWLYCHWANLAKVLFSEMGYFHWRLSWHTNWLLHLDDLAAIILIMIVISLTPLFCKFFFLMLFIVSFWTCQFDDGIFIINLLPFGKNTLFLAVNSSVNDFLSYKGSLKAIQFWQ